MTEPDFSDPRAFRWVESGISGLSRPAEWEALLLVRAPEEEDAALREVAFRRFRDRTIRADAPEQASDALLETFDLAIGDVWDDDPYEAHAVRQDSRTWVVGVREIPGELSRLGVADDAIASLQVAVAPDEERSYFVDGDLIGHELFGTRVDVGTAQALRSLESRGSSRFEAYVVTADRVEDDLWEVKVDPL